MIDHPLNEFDDWKILTSSKSWKVFLKLLDAHKGNLQAKVNKHVRLGEYRLADRAESKMEDVFKIKQLVCDRMNNLRKELDNGNDYQK